MESGSHYFLLVMTVLVRDGFRQLIEMKGSKHGFTNKGPRI